MTPLQYWSHYCVTYDNVGNAWEIFQDGELKATGRMPSFSGVLEGDGAYIIGAYIKATIRIYLLDFQNNLYLYSYYTYLYTQVFKPRSYQY